MVPANTTMAQAPNTSNTAGRTAGEHCIDCCYRAFMFAVVYRWKVRPGHEERFVEAWSAMTRSIRDQCGSFGSRLHLASDGVWVAYAAWPDEQTWQACKPNDPDAAEGMRSAIEQDFEPLRLTVVTDLLTSGWE